jgi:S1-C subfamily serine protease
MSNTGLELSASLAGVVEQVGPSVVRVDARRRHSSTGIIWSDGVVVTAQHTIEQDDEIELGLPDGSNVAATLAGRDPGTDVAVLRTDATVLRPAPFGDTSGLKVGHLVVALGRPGRTTRATLGILSALGNGDGFRTPRGGRIDRYVEPDLGLTPGFNGGPLVDLSGRVLGLNSDALLRGATLTIPTSTLRRIVEQLLEHGELRRAYLGIGSFPVRLPQKLADATGQRTALLVTSVQADGPADAAGVQLGDVLATLDGRPVGDMGDLLELLTDERIGKAAPLRVWRAGQPVELSLTPVARGERS